MRRGPRPAKAKAEAKLPVTRKSPRNDGARIRELEKRLADSLELEKATGQILRQTLESTYHDLRESEQRFRDYAETASDWFWATGPDHKFTYFSGPVDAFGFDRGALLRSRGDEALGKRRWEIAADFTSEPDKWREHMATVERREPFRDFVYKIRRGDGSLAFVSISGKPVFDAEGRFRGYRGVARDITERERAEEALRASEEQWRAVFENNPTMYFMIDAGGSIVQVNPFGAEQLGYTVDELVGQSVLNVFCDADREAVQAHVAVCLQQPGRTLQWEVRKVRKDGTLLWVRETANAMRRAAGDPVVLVACEDITQHKQAEEERQARRWGIESMDRVNRAISGTNDLETMMSDVLDATLSVFDCDRAWLVYPCDPEAPFTRVTMQRTRPQFPGQFALGEDVPMDPDSRTVCRTVRASNGPVTFGPGGEHPMPIDLAKRLGIQSRMIMALDPKGTQPYMFGLSQCSYARVWTPREAFLFQEIGRRLSDALTSLSIFRSLRESEQRYRSIFESTRVSIWEEDFSRVKAAIDELRSSGVRDFRGYFATHPEFVTSAIMMVKVVDVNAASVELFAAKSKDELLVSLPKIFVPETHDVLVEELIAIAEGRTSFEAEAVLQTLEGARRTVLVTISFPPPPGGLERVLVTLTDITARKQAEYLTAQVFESSPDRVDIIGTDYRFRRVNPVFERFWGVAPSTGTGMHVADVVGIADFEARVKPALDRCFLGEDVSWAGWMGTPRGRQYSAITFTPLRPNTERVEAILVIARDLTEHMVAVEALQKAQAELAHVTRVTTLGELAASIAHEVNQPLAAMVADANASLNWLAAANPRLDMARQALDAIVEDGHRAAGVIQRIRQLATKTPPRKDRLDVNDVVRDIVSLVRAELLRHDVSLTEELSSPLPPVLGDRIQLQQVMLNLVMNAIDAMAPVINRPREIVIRSSQPDRDHVMIAVHDTGVGVAHDHLDRLFNAFFTTKPGGMGMGLSISRSIVAAHDGRLWATPNEPHGAIFHLSLPRALAEVETSRLVPEG
jgi:PAS domain S-box-containing protein